jgi:hypothetical protein
VVCAEEKQQDAESVTQGPATVLNVHGTSSSARQFDLEPASTQRSSRSLFLYIEKKSHEICWRRTGRASKLQSIPHCRIGLTNHQRTAAAEMAKSGLLDIVMMRYKVAHSLIKNAHFTAQAARSSLRYGKALKRVAKRLKLLRGVAGGLLGGKAVVALHWTTSLGLAGQ